MSTVDRCHDSETTNCPHGWKQWPGERYGSESRGPTWTHSTVCEILRKTGIPQSSVVCIIRKDLKLKWFKRRRAQELTEANCTAARKLLLKKFSHFAVDFIFFVYEKVFTVASAVKEMW